jgi:hypothetical protein
VTQETISAVEIEGDIPKALQNLRQIQYLLHQLIYGPVSVMQPSDQFNVIKHWSQYTDLRVAEASGSHTSSPPVPATWQDSAAPAVCQDSAAPAVCQNSAAPAVCQNSAAPAVCQDSAVPATWQDSDLDLLVGLWSDETQFSDLAELFTGLPVSPATQ